MGLLSCPFQGRSRRVKRSLCCPLLPPTHCSKSFTLLHVITPAAAEDPQGRVLGMEPCLWLGGSAGLSGLSLSLAVAVAPAWHLGTLPAQARALLTPNTLILLTCAPCRRGQLPGLVLRGG